MKTLKSLLLVAFMTMTVCISTSADEITPFANQAEYNDLMTNPVSFTGIARAGGSGPSIELSADIYSGTPDTETDIDWLSGVSYDFSLSYNLAGSADLSFDLPSIGTESVSKSPTDWHNTIALVFSTGGFVTMDVTDLTINGEAVDDIHLDPFGGWYGLQIGFPGNSSSNVAPVDISGTLVVTTPAGAVADDWYVREDFVQTAAVPEPMSVSFMAIGIAVLWICRRNRSFS